MCLVAGCVSTVTPSDTAALSGAVKLSSPKALPAILPQNEEGGSVQVHESSWVFSPRADSCWVGGPVGPYVDPCCNGSFRSKVYDFTAGITHSRFEVAEATRGAPYAAMFRVTPPAVSGFGLTFLNENDVEIGWKIGWTIGGTSSSAKGVVPPTATTAIAWSCHSGPVSFRYEAQMLSSSPTRHSVTTSWLVGLRAGDCYSGTPGLIAAHDQTTERIGHAAFAVPAGTHGAPFKITGYHVVDTIHPTIVVTFFDGAGRHITNVWANAPLAGNVAVGHGVVPPNAAHAELWSCASGPVFATYRAGGHA